MTKSTTNLILSIDMRGIRTSRILTTPRNPVLPQVTDYRLPNYTACNHCLSDFCPQTLTFWWPAFTFWATAINTALKCKLHSVTIFGLMDTQEISALIKGCYWKLLNLIKQNALQRCLVFSLVFCWSIQSQVCGWSSEGRNNYFLVCNCDEKNWRGFSAWEAAWKFPQFHLNFYGWGLWVVERPSRESGSSPPWKALESSSQGAPWEAFVVRCNKSFMCRPLDLLVVWTQPLSPGGGHCVWRQFKELGLTWWARPIPP